MSVTDREAPGIPPGFFLTPTERDDLRARLAEIEGRALALTAEIGSALNDLRAAAGDPLAMFRLPSGAVAFETTYADHVRVGDWVQRCHGDPDWHFVEDVERPPLAEPGGRYFVRVTHDGTAHDWARTDAIRVACPPADVVARQEQREAGR